MLISKKTFWHLDVFSLQEKSHRLTRYLVYGADFYFLFYSHKEGIMLKKLDPSKVVGLKNQSNCKTIMTIGVQDKK